MCVVTVPVITEKRLLLSLSPYLPLSPHSLSLLPPSIPPFRFLFFLPAFLFLFFPTPSHFFFLSLSPSLPPSLHPFFPLSQVYSSMEHLTQLDPKAPTVT